MAVKLILTNHDCECFYLSDLISRHMLFKAIFVSAAWIFFICSYPYNNDSGLDTYISHRFFLPPLILVTVVVFISDRTWYRQQKKKIDLLPTACALACIAAFFIINHRLKMRDSSPIVLQVISKAKDNRFSIDFREDKTYKLTQGGFMQSKTVRRGSYEQHDSIIILDDYFLPDNRRLMLRKSPFDSTKVKKPSAVVELLFGKAGVDRSDKFFLYKIDQSGKLLDSVPAYNIIAGPL